MAAVNIMACIFSPKLYRIYSRASQEVTIYQNNFVEQCGDMAISYMFPAGMIYSVWYKKFQYMLYLSMFLVSSYAVRAVGRSFNPTYITFLNVLKRATREPNSENMEMVRRYDFEFKGWPAGYNATRACRLVTEDVVGGSGGGRRKITPAWAASWVIAHTFGIRLIYPGLLVGPMLRNHLEEQRGRMVVNHKGLRAKVVVTDGHFVDVMFFDRRRDVDTTTGKTLVIACEGNAGFYEIGMAVTPLQEGYSVLGWNHPGFGGSSGVPYPVNELNAAEAVFEYATKELGFKEENIVLHGWSIGGYPASYLASQHPSVKAVVLDATFDDILPLALPRMPEFMSSLVEATIRHHVDLRINKELSGYKGPLRLIRRTEDEVIAEPPSSLIGNRGSNLLVDVIRQRYPFLLENDEAESALKDWLKSSHVKDASTAAELVRTPVDIPSNVEQLPNKEKAKLVVKIADRIMADFKSSHCTPLPGELFIVPSPEARMKTGPTPGPSSSTL